MQLEQNIMQKFCTILKYLEKSDPSRFLTLYKMLQAWYVMKPCNSANWCEEHSIHINKCENYKNMPPDSSTIKGVLDVRLSRGKKKSYCTHEAFRLAQSHQWVNANQATHWKLWQKSYIPFIPGFEDISILINCTLLVFTRTRLSDCTDKYNTWLKQGKKPHHLAFQEKLCSKKIVCSHIMKWFIVLTVHAFVCLLRKT